MWNLLIGVLDFTEAPLSQACGLPAPFSREPKVKASLEKGGEPPLGGGGILSSLQQPTDFTKSYASFFFAKKKKRSKKRKEFAFHLYHVAMHHPKI